MALQKLPVIFCLDRAGLVGQDGATHHGVFDLAYLRCVPNLIIFAPSNEVELRHIMYTAQLELDAPIAIRYPRGRGITSNWKQPFKALEIGKGVCLKEGSSKAILSIGSISKNVSEAFKLMSTSESDLFSHYDMRFVKPLDETLLHKVFKSYKTIYTIEDGSEVGGFGSAVLEFASKYSYHNDMSIIGIPDRFIEHASVEELQESVALSPKHLIKRLLS